MNTGGSYNCHCNRGYRLHVGAGGRSCVGERGRGGGGAGPECMGWGLSSRLPRNPLPHPLHSARAPFLPLRPERMRQAPPVRRRWLLHQLSWSLQVQLLRRLPAQSLPTACVRRCGRRHSNRGSSAVPRPGVGTEDLNCLCPAQGLSEAGVQEPRVVGSPSCSVSEGGPAEDPELLPGFAVPKRDLLLLPAQTSTSVGTLAPARMANARTNPGASSALPVSPATAARGAGPAAVRAGSGSRIGYRAGLRRQIKGARSGVAPKVGYSRYPVGRGRGSCGESRLQGWASL